MPTYVVRDPQTGKTVKLTGDSPPTEAELTEIFARLGAEPTAATQAHSERSWLEDAAIGALKGAGRTVANLGEAVHQIPGVSQAVDALYGQPGLSERAFQEAERVTTATNTPQAIGQGIEQAAEVIVPGGVASRAAKGLSLASRVAAEAATTGAVAAVQGGDPTTAAALGAAIPIAGAASSRLAPALRAQAAKKITQALGATKERFKAIAEKRAPEILKRGLTGSRASLLQDARAHASEAGKAIDDVLQQHGGQLIPTAPIVDALEEAKAAFTAVRTIPVAQAAREGLLKRPGVKVTGTIADVPIVLDRRPIEQLTRLQDTIRQLGDDASVEHLTAVRRVWDDVVARAGGFAHRRSGTFGVPLAEQTEAWAKREATNAIRKTLADKVPDLAKVNTEYAFWKDLQDVLTATQARTQAQGPGLSRTVGSIVGAATGFGTGQDPMSSIGAAVAGGYLAPMVVRAITSPQMRFASAHLRNTLADAIESGSIGRMNSAAARILATQTAQAVNQ